MRSQLAWMKRLQLSDRIEVRWDMVGGVVAILFDWLVALLTGVFALERCPRTNPWHRDATGPLCAGCPIRLRKDSHKVVGGAYIFAGGLCYLVFHAGHKKARPCVNRPAPISLVP
jgi:hypothetical protein